MLKGNTISNTYRQAAVEQLATIPEPWLERLADENLAYVSLGFNETLADADLLPTYTAKELKQEAEIAAKIRAQVEAEVEQEIADIRRQDPDSDAAAFADIGRADTLLERLSSRLQEQQIGFEVRVQRGELPLSYLKNEFYIVDDPYQEAIDVEHGIEESKESELFTSLLIELNGEEALKGEIVDPANDVLIIPYKLRNEARISPLSEKSYASITGQQMDNNHGVNIWPNRLIVVDDEVVEIPSRKMGYHSVLLHESGHAIDYAAESIPQLNHRETMDRFYAEAVEKYRQGDNTFLTARALDNVREYFAEAVEAYLTKPLPTSNANFYKQENNHDMLKEKNPELFLYIDKLMQLPYPHPAPKT